MCAGQSQNWLNPDPRKHMFSLSGMLGRRLDKTNRLKDKLRETRKAGTVVPEGMELRAKGYGPGGA